MIKRMTQTVLCILIAASVIGCAGSTVQSQQNTEPVLESQLDTVLTKLEEIPSVPDEQPTQKETEPAQTETNAEPDADEGQKPSEQPTESAKPDQPATPTQQSPSKPASAETEKPAPTEPKPTETVKPSEPKPTETAKPTTAPTEVPKTTETQKPTQAPQPTQTQQTSPPPTESEPPEPTEPAFDINYWVSYAKNYAVSVGLVLSGDAVSCWDNPITANARCTNLERDIKDVLNMYAGDPDITDVWIWAVPTGNGSYNLFIGYA